MRKKIIDYSYFIDAHGLFYISTISGKLYEEFYINGVCEISEDIDLSVLYLCYINPNNNE